MNVLIGLIILSAFLQSSFLGLNLVLLFLVAQSYLNESKANYFLAFFSGLLLGLLSAENIGYYPLLFLLAVKITTLFRKLPFNIGIFTVLFPLTLTVLFQSIGNQFILNQTVDYATLPLEILTGLPIYLFLRFWQDRFMVHSTSAVKLKLKK